jgi:hypothetical protein
VEEPVVLAEQVQAVRGPAHLVADSPEMVAQVASIQQIFLDLVENHLQMVEVVAPKEIFMEVLAVLAVAVVRPGEQVVAVDIREAERTIRLEVALIVRAQVVADLSLQVPTNNLLLLKAMVQVL